jgi:DNA-binding CsgD family transcriptional regulator
VNRNTAGTLSHSIRCNSFRSNRVATLLTVLERLHRASLSAQFSPDVFASLEILFPGALFTFEAVDRRTGAVSVETSRSPSPQIDAWRERLIELIPGHPAYPTVKRDPRAVFVVSENLDAETFRRTPYYQDVLIPMGMHHQLVTGLDVSTHVAWFTISRAADFSHADIELARTLAPHLTVAHSTHQMITKLNAASNPGFHPETCKGTGLTPRELEVVTWLVEGKRDSEISLILGAATRTIQKHVQRIFAKLGVETRTAAAMEVMRRSALGV